MLNNAAPRRLQVGSDAEVVSSLEEALELLPKGGGKEAGMLVALGLIGADASEVCASGRAGAAAEHAASNAPPPGSSLGC